MVMFRWLGYLFKLFMVIMCVASVLWILSALCWFVHFILFMPYLIVIALFWLSVFYIESSVLLALYN